MLVKKDNEYIIYPSKFINGTQVYRIDFQNSNVRNFSVKVK